MDVIYHKINDAKYKVSTTTKGKGYGKSSVRKRGKKKGNNSKNKNKNKRKRKNKRNADKDTTDEDADTDDNHEEDEEKSTQCAIPKEIDTLHPETAQNMIQEGGLVTFVHDHFIINKKDNHSFYDLAFGFGPGHLICMNEIGDNLCRWLQSSPNDRSMQVFAKLKGEFDENAWKKTMEWILNAYKKNPFDTSVFGALQTTQALLNEYSPSQHEQERCSDYTANIFSDDYLKLIKIINKFHSKTSVTKDELKWVIEQLTILVKKYKNQEILALGPINQLYSNDNLGASYYEEATSYSINEKTTISKSAQEIDGIKQGLKSGVNHGFSIFPQLFTIVPPHFMTQRQFKTDISKYNDSTMIEMTNQSFDDYLKKEHKMMQHLKLNEDKSHQLKQSKLEHASVDPKIYELKSSSNGNSKDVLFLIPKSGVYQPLKSAIIEFVSVEMKQVTTCNKFYKEIKFEHGSSELLRELSTIKKNAFESSIRSKSKK